MFRIKHKLLHLILWLDEITRDIKSFLIILGGIVVLFSFYLLKGIEDLYIKAGFIWFVADLFNLRGIPFKPSDKKQPCNCNC